MEWSISLACVAVLLITAFISDLKSMRIPNLLTATFFAGGGIFHTAVSGAGGAIHSLLGALAGFGPLLALYLLKGIGAGDVKLFAALGAWIGAAAVTQVLLYAILYAGLVGLVLVFIHGRFGKRLKYWLYSFFAVPAVWDRREALSDLAKGGLKFPFMLAVAPGAVTVWLAAGIS